MNGQGKNKNCSNFKSREKGIGSSYRNIYDANCKECVYFSSQNCGMDVADSLSPDMNAFF